MDVWTFLPWAILMALTPGPNNFCALHHGIRFGVLAALIGTIGRVLAFAIFLLISGVGLGAMLLASETAFTLVIRKPLCCSLRYFPSFWIHPSRQHRNF